MLKRVLILLGETPSSVSARKYAFRLAQETKAKLAGLAGIDLSYIEAPMPGRAGSTAIKVWLEQKLKKQASKSRERLHKSYKRECKSHRVSFEWLSFDGDPNATLQLVVETRDLVVTGYDTAFRGNIRQPLSQTVAQFLRLTPRPIIICGDEAAAAREVMIAYDGSVAAMRAIQMFALLGLDSDRRILVTSIDSDQELSARRASGAANYLRSHGYKVEEIPITSRVHPKKVLHIEVTDRKIGTLVMGAFGHRGFREFLFGSTTSELTENPPCALFVYR